jgi:hypothetical protein
MPGTETLKGIDRMARPLALALVATLLASCKSYPKTDLIYGRQVIPSQRTGSLGSIAPGTPPPQYYEPGSGSGGNNLPAAPSADDRAPPGGFGFQGSSSRTVTPDSGSSSGWGRPGATSDFGNSGIRAPSRATGPDDFSRRPAADPSGYGPSKYENPQPGASSSGSNFAPPAPSSGGSPFGSSRDSGVPPSPSGADNWRPDTPYSSTSYERTGGSYDRNVSGGWGSASASSARSGEVVDIMDLPARRASGPDSTPYSRVEPAGYTAYAAPLDGAERSAPRELPSAGDEGPYGYDRGYRWLKGRLEYSPTSRRWKLRYIPITGHTDGYGGSVMLEDSPALQEMQRGDAVLIEGRIIGNGETGGFAPLYRAERVSRLP